MTQHLRSRGYRLTPPRRAVLSVFRRGDEHLSPEEVLSRARSYCPSVGRATVYRTLDLLTELGYLRPIYLGGRPCFTRIENGHHHLVCSSCSTVIECEDEGFARLARRLGRRLGFQIEKQLLEFYGTCGRCRREGRTSGP